MQRNSGMFLCECHWRSKINILSFERCDCKSQCAFWDSFTKEIHGITGRQAVEFLYKCVNNQIKHRLFKDTF